MAQALYRYQQAIDVATHVDLYRTFIRGSKELCAVKACFCNRCINLQCSIIGTNVWAIKSVVAANMREGGYDR